MKSSFLVAALLAVALTACGKKEEAPALDTNAPSMEASAPAPAPAPAMEMPPASAPAHTMASGAMPDGVAH